MAAFLGPQNTRLALRKRGLPLSQLSQACAVPVLGYAYACHPVSVVAFSTAFKHAVSFIVHPTYHGLFLCYFVPPWLHRSWGGSVTAAANPTQQRVAAGADSSDRLEWGNWHHD